MLLLKAFVLGGIFLLLSEGQTLHLATDVDDFPLVYELPNGTVSGLNIFVMAELAFRFNFTFTTTKNAPDFLWGEYVNGSWSGLLGLVYSGKKDVTINYFSMPLDMKRLEHFDASISYMWEGFGFALKKQEPFPAWMSLLHPFSKPVWAAVMITSVTVPALLCILHRMSRDDVVARRMQMADVYTNYFMGLLNQSSPKSPTSSAIRLTSVGWWLGGLLITLYYSSNLIAVLTIPVFPEQLQTVHQLAASGLRVSMVDYGEFLEPAMLTSGQRDLHVLGTRMDLVRLSSANASRAYQKLLEMMIGGSHAITDTYSYLKSFVQSSNSSHYFLREQIFPGPLAFFFRKGSPWREKINIGIRRLSEAGLLQKWYGDLMERTKNERDTRRQSRPLTLRHLEGPFWLYILGISVAMAMFCAELSSCVHKPARLTC